MSDKQSRPDAVDNQQGGYEVSGGQARYPVHIIPETSCSLRSYLALLEDQRHLLDKEINRLELTDIPCATDGHERPLVVNRIQSEPTQVADENYRLPKVQQQNPVIPRFTVFFARMRRVAARVWIFITRNLIVQMVVLKSRKELREAGLDVKIAEFLKPFNNQVYNLPYLRRRHNKLLKMCTESEALAQITGTARLIISNAPDDVMANLKTALVNSHNRAEPPNDQRWRLPEVTTLLRGSPATVRAQLRFHLDNSNNVARRVIIIDLHEDDGESIESLVGHINESDTLIVGGSEEVPADLSGWDKTAKIEDSYWYSSNPPKHWRRDYIPGEPAQSWPKISIVTVSYNQVEFIEQCLDSVLSQGYPNLQYIVVDGGSTDGTVEILERYRDRLDKLIIEPDSGQSNALNKGFRFADGDIMNWICSDDMLASGALFHVGRAFTDQAVEMIAGGCRVVNENGQLKSVHHTNLPFNRPVRLRFSDMLDFLGSWQCSNYFFQPEVFFSRSIWKKSGGYLKEYLYYAMDYDMFLRMALAGGRIYHIPYSIGISRQHDQQKTRHDSMEYLPQIKSILAEHAGLIEKVCSLKPVEESSDC